MLAIRLQRTGRKGHAQFRIIVQDSRRTPTSGAVVAQLGHYNPHAKETTIDKAKAAYYLEHGAQPSEGVVRLLQKEGVTLPTWVKLASDKARKTRHPEKLRKNQPEVPKEAEAPVSEEAVAVEPADPSTEPAPDTSPEVEAEATIAEAETEKPATETEDAATETADKKE